MVVNEDLWIGRCPKCGNTDPNVQCPVTLGTPMQCQECPVNPWRGKGNYEEVLYYLCMHCGQRYLTPNVDPQDFLLEATK